MDNFFFPPLRVLLLLPLEYFAGLTNPLLFFAWSAFFSLSQVVDGLQAFRTGHEDDQTSGCSALSETTTRLAGCSAS
jgi:hypothetical protein